MHCHAMQALGRACGCHTTHPRTNLLRSHVVLDVADALSQFLLNRRQGSGHQSSMWPHQLLQVHACVPVVRRKAVARPVLRLDGGKR